MLRSEEARRPLSPPLSTRLRFGRAAGFQTFSHIARRFLSDFFFCELSIVHQRRNNR